MEKEKAFVRLARKAEVRAEATSLDSMGTRNKLLLRRGGRKGREGGNKERRGKKGKVEQAGKRKQKNKEERCALSLEVFTTKTEGANAQMEKVDEPSSTLERSEKKGKCKDRGKCFEQSKVLLSAFNRFFAPEKKTLGCGQSQKTKRQ